MNAMNVDALIIKLQKEIESLKKQLKEANKEKKVIIEVGGEHGDGNVELVEKSAGVSVIIKDWDNAYLPEGADEQDEVVPEKREWEANVEI